MDPHGDDELAGELYDLTRQLRGALLRHASLGAWAAPAAPTAQLTAEALADLEARAEPPPSHTASSHAALDSDAVPTTLDERTAAFAARTGAAASGPAASTAGPSAPMLFDGPDPDEHDAPAIARRPLPQIRAELGDCTRCKLHSTRRSIVFGVGSPDTPLMFVGEAPGEHEDRRGEPFVGPAGELLDKMIEAMGWTRSAVYIANTTKCRPPKNRNPEPDELAQCMPFLHEQIASIAPRIIVALGRPASNQLLGVDAPISSLRGKFHDYPRRSAERHSLKIMPTFHPAYLLRDPDKKRLAWSDLKLVMAELERLGIAPPPRS